MTIEVERHVRGKDAKRNPRISSDISQQLVRTITGNHAVAERVVRHGAIDSRVLDLSLLDCDVLGCHDTVVGRSDGGGSRRKVGDYTVLVNGEDGLVARCPGDSCVLFGSNLYAIDLGAGRGGIVIGVAHDVFGRCANRERDVGPRGGEGDVLVDRSREVVRIAVQLPAGEVRSGLGRVVGLGRGSPLLNLLGFDRGATIGVERDGHGLDKLEAIALSEPHLVVGNGDGVARGGDGRELGLAVAVVASDALGVVGREGAARDVGGRCAVRVAAALDDERVARGVGAVAVEAVRGSSAVAGEGAAGDGERTGLLVDGRGAGDGTAGDGHVAGRQVDRDVVRGGDVGSVVDVDDRT